MSGQRVTLHQVAARAGVSVATVSKVLNGRVGVAQATRESVEEALADLGYLSRTARTPSVHSRRSILLILGNATEVDPYSARVLDGVLSAAAELCSTVTVARAPHPREVSPQFLVEEVIAEGHDGAVVVTPDFTAEDLAFLVRRKVAVAMIDPIDPQHDEGVSIGTTNWSGGLTATQYLIGLGHRRIGLVGGPLRRLVARARQDGYVAALELAHIPFDPTLVGSGPFQYEAGWEIGERLLDLTDPPTAIFATSDAAALGVMAAARTRGLRIPEDLSVVGFDDTWAATYAVPPLTTIRQPLREMGREAVKAVIAQANGVELPSRRVALNAELVVRNSAAPLRS